MTNKLEKLSYSAIGCFKNCPYRFKLQYIDKIKPAVKGSVHTAFGSAFHHVIEMLLKSVITKSQATETFMNKLVEICVNDGIVMDYAKYLARFKKELPSFLSDHLDSYKNGNYTTEQRFSIPYLDFVIVGVMDYTRLDGSILELKDWKTGKYFEDPNQLRFYAFAQSKLMDFSKISKINGLLHFLSHNKLYNTDITLEDVENTGKEIENFVETVRNMESFKKTRNNCFFCDYKDLCKQGDNPYIGNITTFKGKEQ